MSLYSRRKTSGVFSCASLIRLRPESRDLVHNIRDIPENQTYAANPVIDYIDEPCPPHAAAIFAACFT